MINFLQKYLTLDKEDEDRRERSDRNKDARQRKNLRESLDLGQSAFILAGKFKEI